MYQKNQELFAADVTSCIRSGAAGAVLSTIGSQQDFEQVQRLWMKIREHSNAKNAPLKF
jgi:hypothetical protein